MDTAALIVAIGLGMDAMSVSMAIGVRWHGPRQKFRLAWHMGLFQFLMPIVGWFLGRRLADLLSSIGLYLASFMVIAIGAKMLLEALKSHPGAVAEQIDEEIESHLHHSPDPTRGWSLIMLSLACSIDAFVVGFSLGLKSGEIWLTGILIGIVAALMALFGVSVGKRFGTAFGKPAEIFGAVILMVIGASFLLF